MAGISDPFADLGPPARIKILCLGLADINLLDRARSLHIEHVSPAKLLRSEISRPRSPAAADETTMAALRRWFFTRKPDAGFILTDYPATLLQAQVLDEWFETRSESLQGVFAGAGSPAALIRHYRTHGLLLETAALAA
jgi:adenylate kinase